MCVNCLTSYEAVALNSVAAVTAGSSLWQRLRSREPRAAARQRAWEADAEFLHGLGLDPVAVLGPAPVPERVDA